MKRFTKILCLVMALALLCVGLAFIVSAEETNTVKIVAKDGTETYYLDYDAAMTQLKNGDTVVLLADTAASGKGYNNAEDGYTIDLNGHTLDGSASKGFLFNVQNTTLNIVGNGTIVVPNTSGKGVVLIEEKYPNSTININGGKGGIQIVGTAANVDRGVLMNGGTMNVSNVNFNYDNQKDMALFNLVKNASMTLTNVSTYQDHYYTFVLEDNSSVYAKYCDFVVCDPASATGKDSGLVIVKNVDFATDTTPEEKVTFKMDNCYAATQASTLKSGQFINLQNANKKKDDKPTEDYVDADGFKIPLKGHKSELVFNNCTLFSSWRLVIGIHDKEDRAVHHRETTVTFNSCNIAVGKVNTSGVGDDDNFVRGNELIYFNNCHLKKASNGDSTCFDVKSQHSSQTSLPLSVTLGAGTYIDAPVANLSNANLADESLKLIDVSSVDACHRTYVGTEAPKTTDAMKQTSFDYEAAWVRTLSQGSKTASKKVYNYNSKTLGGTAERGGEYSLGVNKYDNNNYLRFESVSGDYKQDPYYTVSAKYTLAETAYTVLEFEMMTETVHPAASMYFNYRYSKLDTSKGTWGDANGDSAKAKFGISYDASTGKNYYTFNGSKVADYDYATGEWVNIAIVAKIVTTKDTSGTPTAYAITTLVYINGELVGQTTTSPVVGVSATAKDHYISEFRYHYTTTGTRADATTSIDNVSIKQYGTDYTGAIANMFGTENAKTLPENAGFCYYGDRPLGNPVASVGNVFYDSVEDAIANANGEIVTLFTDVTEPVMISAPVKIDSQGYNIKFVTGTTVAEGMYRILNRNGNVTEWAKVSGSPTEIVKTVIFHDGTGNAGRVAGSYPIGTEIVYRGTGVVEQKVTADGQIVKFIGWTATQGSGEIYQLGTVTTTGTLNLYPVYEEIGSALYTVTIGENIYGGVKLSELIADLARSNKTDTTTVKLFGDIIENKVEFNIPAETTVNFDLNGHMIAAHAKQNTFATGDGCTLYIYSSAPNGRIFVKNKDVYQNNDNNGGPVINNQGKNAKAYLGAKDGQYGENLFYAGACVVDTGTAYSETYIDGGYYVRNVVDYSGFFITRNAGKMEIKNATIVNPVSTSQFFNLAGSNGTWTVDNCTVIGQSESANTGLINTVASGASIVITNSSFYHTNTNSKDGVTYGAGNTSSANMTNKLAGYKTVQTDKKEKVTIRYNTYGPQSEFATNGYSYEINEYEIQIATYFVMVEDSYVEPTVDDLMWNLTLHSDFTINVYLPKALVDNGTISHVRTARLAYVKSPEAQTAFIDGVEYLVYAVTVNADETDRNIQYRFTFNDELKSTYVVDLTIYKYVQTILNSSAQPQVAKELMMACADYVNEAYQLLKGEDNANMAALLADEAYAAYKPAANTNYGTAADTTAIADAIASAQMVLDADPHFLFTVQKNFTGTVTVTYKVKGEDVNYTVEVAAVADDAAAVTVAFDKLRMYQLGDSFTITAVGTAGETAVNASTTYGLGAYILGLEAEDVNADFAKALATFAKAAKAYKYAPQA